MISITLEREVLLVYPESSINNYMKLRAMERRLFCVTQCVKCFISILGCLPIYINFMYTYW